MLGLGKDTSGIFVRGITSALAGLSSSRKEKLLLDVRRIRELEDLHNSVLEISEQMFHESIHRDNDPSEKNSLQTIPIDLLLLLQEYPDVQAGTSSLSKGRNGIVFFYLEKEDHPRHLRQNDACNPFIKQNK